MGSSPSISARPEVGRSSPVKHRKVVVLPAPFGPRNPKTSPARTLSVSPSTPTTAPYILVSPLSSMAYPVPMEPVCRRPQARAPRTTVPEASGKEDALLLRIRRTWAPAVAERVGLPSASALGPAMYFLNLATTRGRQHVRGRSATACSAAIGGRHVDAVERELGVRAGSGFPRRSSVAASSAMPCTTAQPRSDGRSLPRSTGPGASRFGPTIPVATPQSLERLRHEADDLL